MSPCPPYDRRPWPREPTDLRCLVTVGGRWNGGRLGASVSDVDVTIITLITETPDKRPARSGIDPTTLPILLATTRVRTPRHSRPERVVDTPQIHLYTPTIHLYTQRNSIHNVQQRRRGL